MKIEMKPTISLYELIRAVEIQYDISIRYIDALDWMDASQEGYFLYNYGNSDEDIYYNPAIVCVRNFLRNVIPNYKEVFIEV